MSNKNYTCPHCGKDLAAWKVPEMACWGTRIQYVCFNDECSYFTKGWEWMRDKYEVKASYRYRLDPETGEEGPLPVWSADALKSGIIENQEKK